MDNDFGSSPDGLRYAVELMGRDFSAGDVLALPQCLPERGIGATSALDILAPHVLGGATRLGAPTAFGYMDPPTPWVSWAVTLWNASLNQNLLHPATAPVARRIEQTTVAWLVPFFGMNGGHLTPGSSLANLTAMWAARDVAGVTTIVASESAHVSVAKAARILGLQFHAVPVDACDRLLANALPTDLSRAALVLTAGTTGTGAVDSLALVGRAAWTHVDAAWAGPLRLSRHAGLLDGVERADSVAMSAHKWLFQPKESALVFFRDTEKAHAAVSFGANYLAVPNVGLQGSHGATAAPLLATLLAWGREGIAARVEHCMQLAQHLAEFVAADPRLTLYAEPVTGIVAWRPKDVTSFERVLQRLPAGSTSTTVIAGERWLRNVAANPNADVAILTEAIDQGLSGAG